MIEISNLSHTHPGAHPLFNGLTLNLRELGFYAFCGPSGSGKSTLLRLIAGLEKPSQGLIHACGDTAFMFQEPALLPWRTVRQNLALLSEFKGESLPEKLLKDLLTLVRLDLSVADLYPYQLSGGMKARVSFARAILAIELFSASPQSEGRVLLLDEPFSALDEANQLALWLDLRKIHDEKKLTTILVTHSVSEAVFLSDQVLVLGHHGSLKEHLHLNLQGPRKLSLLSEIRFHQESVRVRKALLGNELRFE